MNVNLPQMASAANEASALLKALGSPSRLMILCQIAGRERAVGDLASLLGLRDSTVSQHLARLRKEGLVQARRDGQTIWYSIASPEAAAVLETLFRIYCEPGETCAAPLPHAEPAR